LSKARADVARGAALAPRKRGRTGLDPCRWCFIAETWIKTNMAPLRGWGPKGERLALCAVTAIG